MNDEEQQYIRGQIEDAYNQGRNEGSVGQSSMFGSTYSQNLVEYQLDMREELERIEHLLRGHKLETDEKGNTIWKPQTDQKFIPFNEYGVQLLLNVVSFYLNRNTILSNYSEPMINDKVYDLGIELADMIMMKYDEMGMDIEEKTKLYPMIVREIVDTVHSSYLRALNGGERESLRTARHVTQSDSMGSQPNYSAIQGGQKKHFGGILNPANWGGNR